MVSTRAVAAAALILTLVIALVIVIVTFATIVTIVATMSSLAMLALLTLLALLAVSTMTTAIAMLTIPDHGVVPSVDPVAGAIVMMLSLAARRELSRWNARIERRMPSLCVRGHGNEHCACRKHQQSVFHAGSPSDKKPTGWTPAVHIMHVREVARTDPKTA